MKKINKSSDFLRKNIERLYGYLSIFKIQLCIFIISIGFALITNTINLVISHDMYGDDAGIVLGSTIGSPDNAWYLNQIVNYVKGFGFTIDPLDAIYSVRRTPGYPIFYGFHYLLFGELGAHAVIPYTQTFLHGVAAVFMFKIAFLLSRSIKTSFLAGALYGFSPFISSFLFMTITESIFPAVIVCTIYLAFSSFKNNSFLRSFFAGVMMAFTVLISPRTGLTIFFIFGLLFYFGKLKYINKFKIGLIFTFAFLISMTPWTVRNYLLLDRFIPLETYYINHTMEEQGLKNIALYRWWSTWGSPDGVRLHKDLLKDMYDNNSDRSIDNFVNTEVPAWVFNVESKGQLRILLRNYQKCIQRSIELNGGRRLRYLEIPDPCEYAVSNALDDFSTKIIAAYPFQVYVVSPIYKRGMQYIFHSAIHTWRSLDDFRSHPLKMMIKGLAYSINVALWLFSLAYLLSSISIAERFLLGVVPIVTFLFMVYYRHVEGRYLLGAYPFLYLMTALFLSKSLAPLIYKVFYTNLMQDKK
jgi:hypothetical protein